MWSWHIAAEGLPMISPYKMRIAVLADLITQVSELDQLRERVREAQLALLRSGRYFIEAPPIAPRAPSPDQ
jgi:hypothetical protein